MSSDAADETRPQDQGTLTDAEQSDDAVRTDADHHVMELLSDHVPLSLLVDLTSPEGPASEEILEAEGVPENSWWVTGEGGDLGSVGKDLGEAEGDDESDDDTEDGVDETGDGVDDVSSR